MAPFSAPRNRFDVGIDSIDANGGECTSFARDGSNSKKRPRLLMNYPLLRGSEAKYCLSGPTTAAFSNQTHPSQMKYIHHHSDGYTKSHQNRFTRSCKRCHGKRPKFGRILPAWYLNTNLGVCGSAWPSLRPQSEDTALITLHRL